MIDSAKSHIFFLIWLSLYYLLTTTIFFSRNFSPIFQCAMTSYCCIFCDNSTLTNLQHFNQSPMNDRYSNILNVKEIKLCCLLKANFSTRRSICSLVKVSKPSTSARPKSVRNSISPKPKTSQWLYYKKNNALCERCSCMLPSPLTLNHPKVQ